VKHRFCRLSAIPFVFLAAVLALRGAPQAEPQVVASLVSSVATVQAGKPFRVALRLVHRPTWHTYWINPGTGLATSIKWTLPPGWTAGDIEWPVPHLIKDRDGNVTGNGYEGDLLLPVMLTPAAGAEAAGSATITAAADWLMCQNVCVPGNATVSKTLAVGDGPAKADEDWSPKIAAVVAKLPRGDAGWAVTASREAKTVTLHVAKARGADVIPAELHFFSADGLIAYDQPQPIEPDGKGGFTLALPISPDAPPDVTGLHGVLAAESGWRKDGSLPGLAVDLAFGAASAASAGAASPSGATPLIPQSGLFGTLCLAFLGGLILNLMPCVFPVLGIKILGFVNQAGTDRRKVVTHGLSFTAGVFLSFWALAGLLAILRHGGAQLGWGFQLQSPVFVFGLTAGLLIFALNLSGVFEFGLSATSIGGSLQTRGGYSGSFFTGVLATVVATPCSAPFLAPALGAALTLSVGASFAVFSCIALGLSTPYLLLSAFPAAIKLLPRPGAWM